jgi:predicted kinase
MLKLYILCGVGFSGKSTLAKKIADHTGAILVSQDALYFEKEKELNLNLDSDKQWRMLLDMCLDTIRTCLMEGKSVVFDSTNTRYEHREEVRNMALAANAESMVIFLDTPIQVQKDRQEKNKLTKERHDVKQEYLDEAIAELEVPTPEENVRVFSPNTDINDFLNTLG